MSLYNHHFIWGSEGIDMLPKGIFCNGWVLIEREKMSKSKGNFYTLSDFCKKYSSDAFRITLAGSGDTLDDANVEIEEVDQAVLKLSNLEQLLQELKDQYKNLREDSPKKLEFFDSVFENEIYKMIYKADKDYNSMLFREVIKNIFFSLQHIREEYRLSCDNHGYKK